MRVAYADPPYVGQAHRYGDAQETDQAALVERLVAEFPEGWGLSLSVPSVRTILPLCPEDVRLCAWVKPFASWKPGNTLAYAWEPVILRPARRRGRERPSVRDYIAANCTLAEPGRPASEPRFFGQKPWAFSFWLFEALGLEPGDEFVDLYPGSGAVTRAWESWCRQTDMFRDARESSA